MAEQPVNRRVDQTLPKRQTIPGLGRTPAAALFSTRTETLLLVGLALIALLVQGINMFHAPTLGRLGDEGIYMEQAWSVLHAGRLSPYTYWYDHAPAGWILIASWMGLLGGPHAFGTAVDTGRVLMLLLHVAIVLLTYILARRLRISMPFAGLAAFLLSISPLAITYQRMVLLDNIMNFWILVSLNLLFTGQRYWLTVILSGVTFGLAALSKEPALFLVPAVLFLVYRQGRDQKEPLTLPAWIIPFVLVVGLYPLYALLRGELMPITLFGRHLDAQTGVYLIDTLTWQGGRGGGSIFNLGSDFWQQFRTNWLPVDPFLTLVGILAVIANLVKGVHDRRFLAVGLLGLFPLIYLARGGVVFDFYILDALPFFVLNIALLLDDLVSTALPHTSSVYAAGGVGLALLGLYFLTGQMLPLFQSAPDQPYRQALSWIQANVNPDSYMIIPDNYWVDLHDPGNGKPAFINAHSYWKVDGDPQVSDSIFHDTWQMADYVVLFPGTRQDMQANNMTISQQALDHASLVQRWENGSSFVEVWKVNNSISSDQRLLSESYQYLKSHFSQNGAYTNSDGSVTSENQGLALLRAAWINDKSEFYRVWKWTNANLLNSKGLLAYQWKGGGVNDASTNANGDTYTVLALLFAGKRWNDRSLVTAGTQMAQAIRKNEVVEVGGKLYLTAGDWAVSQDIVALNPSYFAPYAYQVFDTVDPGDGWQNIIDSGYPMIAQASSLSFHGEQPAGLPPDWVGLDKNSGLLTKLSLANTPDTTQYGYIAARTYWQIALDLRYIQDGRAQAYLSQSDFIAGEVSRQGYPSSVYSHDGKVVVQVPSTVGTAGALGVMINRDAGAAGALYQSQIVDTAVRSTDGIYWGNPDDLSTQEWGWLAIGLYANQLPNLWWYIPPGS